MLPAAEQIVAMTGSTVLIGTLAHMPVKLILDNQSTASAVLYISLNGGSNLIQWKTFAAGEALVLDGDIYMFPSGTKFYANGTNATGSFSVSYTYINL